MLGVVATLIAGVGGMVTGANKPMRSNRLMQLRVLRTLSDGTKHMSELADELRMSASRLTHLVSRLESAGLVEKHADPGDRRIKWVNLTGQGLSQMSTHRSLRSHRALEILSALSEEDREIVMDSLEVLYIQAMAITQVGAPALEAETFR